MPTGPKQSAHNTKKVMTAGWGKTFLRCHLFIYLIQRQHNTSVRLCLSVRQTCCYLPRMSPTTRDKKIPTPSIVLQGRWTHDSGLFPAFSPRSFAFLAFFLISQFSLIMLIMFNESTRIFVEKMRKKGGQPPVFQQQQQNT